MIIEIGSDKNLILNTIVYSTSRAAYARFTYISEYDKSDSNLPLKPNDPVIIIKDNHTMFNGWIIQINRKASGGGSGELIEYEAVDGRYFLGQLTALYKDTPVFSFNEGTRYYSSGEIVDMVTNSFPSKFVRNFDTSLLTYKPLDLSYSGNTYESIVNEMVESNGHYKWYVDVNRNMQVVNLRNVTGYDVYIGETNEKVSDHSGEYDVIDHEFQYSLVGRFSRVRAHGFASGTSSKEDYLSDVCEATTTGKQEEGIESDRVFWTTQHIRGVWAGIFFGQTTKYISIPVTSSFDLGQISDYVAPLLEEDEFTKWGFWCPIDPIRIVGSTTLSIQRRKYNSERYPLPGHNLPNWVATTQTNKEISQGPSINYLPGSRQFLLGGWFPIIATFHTSEPIFQAKFIGETYGESLGAPQTLEIRMNGRSYEITTDRQLYLRFKLMPPTIMTVKYRYTQVRSKDIPKDDELEEFNSEVHEDRGGKPSDTEQATTIKQIGPGGTSYDWYNWDLRKDIVVHENTDDPETFSQQIQDEADNLHDKVKDVVISGKVVLKGIKTDLTLNHGINVHNSNLTQWETIKANINSITYDFNEETTTINLSNEYT